jgi:ABC-type Fe3+-hydroxamate transport system substrate-binding protein
LALAAVLLIFAATATTWFASFTQKKTANAVDTVAVLGDGHVVCGALTSRAGTNELSLALSSKQAKTVTDKGGKTTTTSSTVTTTVALTGAKSVTPVDSCP